MPPLTAESPVSAGAAFDDDAWEDLLNYIEEKRVIPIIGPELCVVQTDAGPENLYTWLARSLAVRLNQPVRRRRRSTMSSCGISPGAAVARIFMRASAPSCASRRSPRRPRW